MAQLLPLTLAKLLLIMPPAEFLSHKKIDAPLHRNFRLAWLKYLIYTHRILILLINPISIHIICTSLVHFSLRYSSGHSPRKWELFIFSQEILFSTTLTTLRLRDDFQ